MMWKKNPIFNTWGNEIAAIAELRQDRGEQCSPAGEDRRNWASGELPIRKSGIYFGEIYDARLERLEADRGSEVVPFDTELLVPHEIQPVRELESFLPVLTWKDGEDRILHDFGQNLAGYVAFTARGEAGAKVIVEHSEIIDRDNSFDNRNYRTAEARIEYVLKGGGEESYRPFFTFQGFRFARVTIEGKVKVTFPLPPCRSVRCRRRRAASYPATPW